MEHNTSTEYATRWSKALFATAMVYLLASSITVLPEGYLIADLIIVLTALSFLVLWLGFPYILYKDRKQIFNNTDWNPSKLYYFGFLPSILGAIVILVYLYRRNKTFEKQESTSSETDSVERSEFME